MRIWLINPSILCRKHLLGEHLEIHYAAGYLRKNNPIIKRWADKGFIETKNIVSKKAKPQVVPIAQVVPCLKFWAALILLQGLLLILPCEARCQEIDLNIIAQIESSNNPLAYNKVNKARGMYQITEICLKDYNQQNNAKIVPTSLFNPKIGEMVAKWYLKARIPLLLQKKGIPVTIDNIIWAYNAGIGKVVKGIMPKETKNYIKKYRKLAKEGLK